MVFWRGKRCLLLSVVGCPDFESFSLVAACACELSNDTESTADSINDFIMLVL